MDWWQILYSFVGGFLGFGFALLTEALLNSFKKKEERKKLYNNLIDELKSISDNLRGNEKVSVPIYFDTPIWFSLNSTGIILSLVNTDDKIYNEVIMIYNRIYAMKEMEKNIDYFQCNITKIRTEIVEKIDNIKKIL